MCWRWILEDKQVVKVKYKTMSEVKEEEEEEE